MLSYGFKECNVDTSNLDRTLYYYFNSNELDPEAAKLEESVTSSINLYLNYNANLDEDMELIESIIPKINNIIEETKVLNEKLRYDFVVFIVSEFSDEEKDLLLRLHNQYVNYRLIADWSNYDKSGYFILGDIFLNHNNILNPKTHKIIDYFISRHDKFGKFTLSDKYLISRGIATFSACIDILNKYNKDSFLYFYLKYALLYSRPYNKNWANLTEEETKKEFNLLYDIVYSYEKEADFFYKNPSGCRYCTVGYYFFLGYPSADNNLYEAMKDVNLFVYIIINFVKILNDINTKDDGVEDIPDSIKYGSLKIVYKSALNRDFKYDIKDFSIKYKISGFPEVLSFIVVNKMANIYVPIIGTVDAYGLYNILIPSSEKVLNSLLEMYGVPKPNPLIPLNNETKFLLNIENERFPWIFMDLSNLIYTGMVDISKHLGLPESENGKKDYQFYGFNVKV